jgi:hypothetical protein
LGNPNGRVRSQLDWLDFDEPHLWHVNIKFNWRDMAAKIFDQLLHFVFLEIFVVVNDDVANSTFSTPQFVIESLSSNLPVKEVASEPKEKTEPSSLASSSASGTFLIGFTVCDRIQLIETREFNLELTFGVGFLSEIFFLSIKMTAG